MVRWTDQGGFRRRGVHRILPVPLDSITASVSRRIVCGTQRCPSLSTVLSIVFLIVRIDDRLRNNAIRWLWGVQAATTGTSRHGKWLSDLKGRAHG